MHQPELKRFKERGDNFRFNKPRPKKVDQVWMSDITYIKVQDIYKYLGVIIDLYLRRTSNWSLTDTRTTEEKPTILQRSIRERKPS